MEKTIAEALLAIKAVFFRPNDPFTWASGIKSPVYCDNRLILTAPKQRKIVEQAIADTVKKNYPECEVLMGTSTAGIAHAAIAASILDMPMGYVRSGAKDHGRQNQIEGKLEKGQKVVVIEDLISTGGSVIEVVNVLREAGAEVLGIVSIFTYGMQKGLDRLAAANVKNVSLTNFDVIAQVAAQTGYIKPEDVERLISALDENLPEDYYYVTRYKSKKHRHFMMRIAPKGYSSEVLHVDVFWLWGAPSSPIKLKRMKQLYNKCKVWGLWKLCPIKYFANASFGSPIGNTICFA